MAISLGFFIIWMNLFEVNFLAILLLFLMTPAMQFLVSPLMTLLGVYKYLSPMLLVYAARPELYDLHNGTSFDYLFHYRKTRSGNQWQNRLLLYYIQGLLEVIRQIESEQLPATIEVRGSTYFLADSTIERLGFEAHPTVWYEKANLVINYLDLIWMYSLSKGKLSLPKMSNVKTATTTGERLVAQKSKLESLKAFLEKR